MSEILLGLEGVVCQIKDVLIFGANQKEHNSSLIAGTYWESWSHLECREVPIQPEEDQVPGTCDWWEGHAARPGKDLCHCWAGPTSECDKIAQVYENGEPAQQIFSPLSWTQWTLQGAIKLQVSLGGGTWTRASPLTCKSRADTIHSVDAAWPTSRDQNLRRHLDICIWSGPPPTIKPLTSGGLWPMFPDLWPALRGITSRLRRKHYCHHLGLQKVFELHPWV